MKVAVIDCETTGQDTQEGAELLELGVALVRIEDDGAYIIQSVSSILVRPSGSIPPTAAAIHHITEETLSRENCFTRDFARDWVLSELDSCDAAAAHHAKFDRQFLPEVELPWICTMICAKHLWPDAPAYGNQVLRYWLSLPNTKVCGVPHRASYDAAVTAHLLAREMDVVRSSPTTNVLQAMLTLTETIPLLKVCHFGKYRGMPWAEVPRSYMQWILKCGPEPEGFNDEVRHTCQHYLLDPM